MSRRAHSVRCLAVLHDKFECCDSPFHLIILLLFSSILFPAGRCLSLSLYATTCADNATSAPSPPPPPRHQFQSMPAPTHSWNPTQCTLQLIFSRPPSGGPIRTGSTYQGTSVIRYRREPSTGPASADQIAKAVSTSASAGHSATPASSSGASEYDDFLAHRQTVAEKGALHLHALTTAGGLYKDAKVLDVTSYQVHCLASAASGSSSGSVGPLKVLSVEQEDASAAAAAATSGSGSAKGGAVKSKGGKAKPGKRGAAAEDGEAPTPHATATTASAAGTVDWGSKLVLFEGGNSLPPYSEVELTVQFGGTVQAFDHGGIYAACGSADSAASAEDAPLLTHFEVRFARCAFPCPDDPQYRLDWQLRTLQLPNTYHTVLTNGAERSRKDLPAQAAVQLSFPPCGPLPAYVFSFACFAEGDSGLDVVHSSVDIPDFAGDLATGVGELSALSCSTIPVRVLARPQARIPAATLDRVLRVTVDATAELQRLFQCPLPLLQCEQLDVLLGPTMPYIAGMEHHCSIILNEAIYQPSKKPGGSAAAEVEQTELIVHELTHHWVGNALGLPFAVKEGICQVVEQCVGDTMLGRPVRKYKADVGAGADSAGEGKEKGTVQASEKGHEFTGVSYQHALSSIKRLVADHGFDAFVQGLRQLVHKQIVAPTLAVEEQGGAQVLRRMGADVPSPPYLSTEEFLSVMASSV